MRVLSVAGVFLLLRSGAILAGEGQIEIGPTSIFPIVLTQSGSYLLTTDLATAASGNAIQIEADNVTLDLGGHHLHGTGTAVGSGYGISVQYSRRGATIRNGSISNFNTCLHAGGSSGLVDEVRVSTCAFGLSVIRTVVANSTAEACWAIGIEASDSTLSSSLATGGAAGFNLVASSCTACTANGNSGSGFTLSSSGCAGCVATSNAGGGFDISAGDNLLTTSVARDNTLGSLLGTCTTSGNACFSSNLP